MTGNITRIAVGIAAAVTTFGLATTAWAVQKKKPVMVTMPPKSCTWVQSGTVVPSGSYTRDNQDGSLWKCTNGTWSQSSSKGSGSKKGGGVK